MPVDDNYHELSERQRELVDQISYVQLPDEVHIWPARRPPQCPYCESTNVVYCGEIDDSPPIDDPDVFEPGGAHHFECNACRMGFRGGEDA